MSAQDPRNKFKTDNYEKQEQEVPGIQAKMSPQPDCGEDSCLLYTSPSPRDATLSRMPSSA